MRTFIIIISIIAASPALASVQQMIAAETTRQIGAKWVPVAIRLAKIESGFRCNAVGPKTRHGRARGVFQVMPGTARAMGFNPNRLHECKYGVMAGVEHMKRCISSGVRNDRQMAKCHVSGWGGWNRNLNKSGNSYRNKYVKMVMN
jgi:soluble lytic murein transglycosylase-like protein